MGEHLGLGSGGRRGHEMVVSIGDVARHVGVHKSTVSRTWSHPELVDPTTRARVHAAAEELGYQPNAIAHMLATRTSPLVPLLVPDVANPFFAELAKGVARAVEAHGLHLMLCDTRAGEHRYLDSLRSLRVELLIVAPGSETDLPELIARAREASTVTVLVDRVPSGSPVSSVSVDQQRGVDLAVEHLRGLGHRDLVHVAGPLTTRSGCVRCERFLETVRGSEREPTVISGGYSSAAGRAAADVLMARPELPTGVFAANDLCAFGLMGRFAGAGVRVPEDISVVGFDGLELATHVQPPLTTVRQPVLEIAATAVDIGLEEVSRARQGQVVDPRDVQLDASLMVRGSTGPPAIQNLQSRRR